MNLLRLRNRTTTPGTVPGTVALFADSAGALKEIDGEGTVSDVGAGGGSQTVRVERVTLTPATPGLLTGIEFFTPAVGDQIVYGSPNVLTAIDGNQPLIFGYNAGEDPVATNLFSCDPSSQDAPAGTHWAAGAGTVTVGRYALDTSPVLVRLVSGVSDSYAATDHSTKTITVTGDRTGAYYAGITPSIFGSNAGDGVYTVVSSAYDSGGDTTAIVVAESFADADLVGGSLVYGDPGASSGEVDLVLVLAGTP